MRLIIRIGNELKMKKDVQRYIVVFKKMISLYTSLLLILVSLGGGGCSSSNDKVPKRVLFIVIDSLRADRFGYMGYSRSVTPFMDEIIKNSVNFTRTFSSSNVTLRSVASFMTGKYYSQIHENPRHDALPIDEVSLATAFMKAGFHTRAIITNALVGSTEGFSQGFEQYEFLNSPSKPYADIREINSYIQNNYVKTDGCEFVYIHTMDVHHPYRPPLPFGKDFIEPYSRDLVREGNIVDSKGKPVWGTSPYYAEIHDVQDEDISHIENLYDGVVEYTDAEILTLLKSLNFEPEYDLLILTADHGEQFFEHDFWRHGTSLIPAEIHVPLFFSYKGFATRKVDVPVSLVDLYPTLCDIFGLERPDDLVGISLLPGLCGEPVPSRSIYAETPWGTGPAACTLDLPYLYWAYADTQFYYPENVWPYYEALFNVEDDPYCLLNIISDNAAVADILNNELREINPVWKLYDREVFVENKNIQYGENVFVSYPYTEYSKQPVVHVDKESKILHYNLADEIVLGTAVIDRIATAHVLDFEYILTQGEFIIEVRDTDGSILWQYNLRKAANETRKITRRIYPATTKISLCLKTVVPGIIDIIPPVFREVELPVIPLGNNRPDIDLKEVPTGLTDQERQVLETLGYL